MRVTKTEEHGLRLAMTLAKENGQLAIPELARREKLSEALVAKLLGLLRRGGLVKAERGRAGGYELARPAATIAVAQVIEALGPPLFRGCLEADSIPVQASCAHVEECGLRAVWSLLERHITRSLNQISLADLIQPEAQVLEKLQALWPEWESPPAAGLPHSGPNPT